MGKQRVVSTVLACAMWAASEGVAVISPRWVSERQGRIIDCATVCVTVWALLSRYGIGRKERQELAGHERRLDAYDAAWGAIHDRAKAGRRQGSLQLVRNQGADAG